MSCSLINKETTMVKLVKGNVISVVVSTVGLRLLSSMKD